MNKRPKKLRWYDKHPLTSEAMHYWRQYPPLLQRMIAYRIQEDLRSGKYRKSYIGDPHSFIGISFVKLPRLKAVYKRRRWYDEDPAVRNVIFQMAFLEQADLMKISKCIIRIMPMLPDASQQWSRLPLQEIKHMVTRAFEARILD